MNFTINLKNLYIKCIFIFPLFTLFQGYIDALNKVLFACLFLIQIVFAFSEPVRRKTAFIYASLVILYIWASFNTDFPLYNLNDYFYFAFMVVYFEYFVQNREKLVELVDDNLDFMRLIVIVWNVLVAFSAILPSSYYAEFGGSYTYFVSFTQSTFRLCPAAMFIMTMAFYLMVKTKKRNYIWMTIIPMFCFFAGGSRTYFGIGAILFVVIWYRYCYKKTTFWLSLIPIAVIAVILVGYSAIGDKIASTQYTSDSYFDFWGTVTNSRSVFWAADIESFFEQPILNRLFGCGFNFVYDVNKATVGARIWAHNDFIQVLTTFGFSGLLIYMIEVISIMKELYFKKSAGGGRSKFLSVCVTLIWLINAFFNMFYTYFCSLLMFPIILCALQEMSSKRNITRRILIK